MKLAPGLGVNSQGDKVIMQTGNNYTDTQPEMTYAIPVAIGRLRHKKVSLDCNACIVEMYPDNIMTIYMYVPLWSVFILWCHYNN